MGSVISYFMRRHGHASAEDDVINPETGFSLRQQKVMRKTWDQFIRPNLIDVGVEAMLSLLDDHPDIKQMFPDFKDLPRDQLESNKKFHAHCLMIMNVVNNAVDAFLNNDIQLFIAMLLMTGERHAKRSNGEINAKHFESVKDPLMEALKRRMKLSSKSQNDNWILGMWTQAVDKVVQTIISGINDYKHEI